MKQSKSAISKHVRSVRVVWHLHKSY